MGLQTARATALAAALLVGLAAGCGGSDVPAPAGSAGRMTSVPDGSASDAASGAAGGSSTSEGSGVMAGVTMTARLSTGFSTYPDDPGVRRAPGLVADYTVRNDGAEPVLLLDRVPDTLGSAALSQEPNPEHAWVFMEGDHLRATKQGFDLAPGVTFVAAPVTGARLLAPGEELEGKAYVPIPVESTVPGSEFASPDTLVASPKRWQFCVQVTPTGAERESAGVPGLLEVPVAAPRDGELLCTDPEVIELP
jgi:hypothetical protein